MRRFNFGAAAVMVAAAAASVGCAGTTQSVQAGGSPAVAPTSSPVAGSVGADKLHGLQDYITGSPIAQMYRRAPETSLSHLASAPNLAGVVTGTVTRVSKSGLDHFEAFPGQSAAPNGADLSEVGVNIEVSVASTSARTNAHRGAKIGTTITVRLPIWIGQPENASSADTAYARFEPFAPIGAQVTVLVPANPPLADGSVVVDSTALFFSAGTDGEVVAADRALQPIVKGGHKAAIDNVARTAVVPAR